MDYKKDLAQRLQELKSIEGFPIGKDEDILALSEPPYYTACPNPYITDFVLKNGKPYDESSDSYHSEPFVTDVSEGKNDPIYMAHTYHTKVPYKAIAEYITHYTSENDLILDAFSGSGMAGVAAQFTNRKAIISDLAPIGSFIGKNLNSSTGAIDFYNEAKKILDEVNQELGWLYKTNHTDGTDCVINYVIWSDALQCNYCEQEYVFWDTANIDNNISGSFACPHCNADINKSLSNRVIIKVWDKALQKEIETAKQVPVLINYKKNNKAFNKKPDQIDLDLIKTIDSSSIPYWFPTDVIPDGVKTSEPKRTHKYYHTHQYFTTRNLWVISSIFNKADSSKYKSLIIFLLTSFITKTGSKLHNIGMKDGKINLAGAMPNTLFIPSLFAERNIIELALGKLDDIVRAISGRKNFSEHNVCVQVCSAIDLKTIPANSIDYVFTDPPFGDNLMYSELNFIWESWLKVHTNNHSEAIINSVQSKKISDYYALMHLSFKEYYRILKPKRWITVEFHNSKSSVWNTIQEALSKAGFIIAQVTILDKQQGTYNQMTASGAVKSDLAISAFKPSSRFESRILKEAGNNMEEEFVEQFLSMQPIKVSIERTEKMLYSKMLAFYIQRGFEIKYDAKSFYNLLKRSFIEEDGIWFTSNQINSYFEYKKRLKLEGLDEVKSGGLFLFVTDEKSSLVWLFNFLSEPRSYSDISIAFNQLANIQGDNIPELREMLNQNFIYENDFYRRPKSEPEHNQITEKREKVLLKEFEGLLIKSQTEKGKIKIVRKEALSYGFEMCYKAKRFNDILTIAKKLDKTILENSSELNDFVEAAEIMVEGLS